VGATLGELDENGVEQPLAFASQKLTDTQMAWATIEREAYAVIWALNRFRDIIFGSRVSIFCDHNPLQYIRECAPKSAKLLRWSLALQEFDIEFQYKKGPHNKSAKLLRWSLALQEFDIEFQYKKGPHNVVADWLSRQ